MPTRTKKANPILHVIKADGKIISEPWVGKLKSGAPPFEKMYELIGNGCRTVEQLTILFNGRYLLMFIDEDGRARRNHALNHRASALYANGSFYRASMTRQLYRNLKEKPEVPPATLLDLGFAIFGTTLLWEGELR